MSHYKANLRDIEFCLFDLLGREKVMGSNPYGEVDRDTSMGMLEEVKEAEFNVTEVCFVMAHGVIVLPASNLRNPI